MRLFALNILTDREMKEMEDRAAQRVQEVVTFRQQERDTRTFATQQKHFDSCAEYVSSKVILQLPISVRQRLYCDILDDYFTVCRRSLTDSAHVRYPSGILSHIVFTSRQIGWLSDVFHNFPWVHLADFERNETQLLSTIDRAVTDNNTENVGDINMIERRLAEKWVAYTATEHCNYWNQAIQS